MADAPVPSRRAILVGLPVAAIGIGSALPVAAGTVSPIEAAFEDYKLVLRAFGEAISARIDAQSRYTEPKKPPYRMGIDEGGWSTIPAGNNKARLVLNMGSDNIGELRALISETPTNDEDERYWQERRQESARVTLRKIEEWKTEEAHLLQASGLGAARAAEDAARGLEESHRDAILAMKPANLRDIAMKAATVSEDHEAWRIVDDLIGLTGVIADMGGDDA